MMKRLLLVVCAFVAGATSLKAQRSSMSVSGVLVPQYMASGSSSSELITYTRLRMGPFMPNSSYKYIARCFEFSELDTNILLAGHGGVVYDDNGTHRYVTTHSFSSSGGHDTFKTDFMGFAEMWLGFVGDGSSFFADGKAVYAGLTMIGMTGNDTTYHYVMDSMTVISFGTNSGSDEGTAIYGESFANESHYVSLYDDKDAVGRPLAVTTIESGKYSGATLSNLASFYDNNVFKKAKMWGTIIPNDLANGVRSITRWNAAGLLQYNQQDDNGVWGSSTDTRNPTGGSSAIVINKSDAPLLAPEISFESTPGYFSEKEAEGYVVIQRKYSNGLSQSVDISITGGSATDKADYTQNFKKTITFAPGADATDTIKISILQDEIAEGTENIFFRLENAQNANLGSLKTHEFVLVDDDQLGIFMSSEVLKVNENAGTLNIEVKTSRAVKEAVELTLVVKSKSDSTRIPQEFSLGMVNNRDTTFFIGKTTGRDSVKLMAYIGDDLAYDWDDSVVVVLRKKNGLGNITDSTTLVIIKDNDGPSTIRMVQPSMVVSESVGSVDVKILVVEKKDAGADFALRYLTAESTAKAGLDLTFNPVSQLKSIDGNSPDTIVFNVPIREDDEYEGTEYAKFGLINVSNTTIVKPDTFRITILDNDLPIYSIAKVNKQTKSDGQVDSLGVRCRIQGVVYGINTRASGLGFTIKDYTGGIGVFSSSKTFGYNVKEGDSVMIQGTIGQFQGTAQISDLDTVIRRLSGMTLQKIRIVTAIGEGSESDLVELRRVILVDPLEWPETSLNANAWAYVRVLGSTGRMDTLYIDAESDIDGTPAPKGYLNIAGIGVQFDNKAPYKEKYFLSPRSLNDFSAATLPVIRFEDKTAEITELADSLVMSFRVAPTDENFKVDVVNIGGTAVSPLDFDYQTQTINVIKNQNYYVIKANISDDTEGDGTKTLVFALRNVVGPGSIGADSVLNVTILDNEPSRVKTFADASIQLYPNPSSGVFYIRDMKSQITEVNVRTLSGATIWTNNNPVLEGVSIPVHLNAESGIYLVEVMTQSGEVFTEKAVIK
jgi:hypothetical protein